MKTILKIERLCYVNKCIKSIALFVDGNKKRIAGELFLFLCSVFVLFVAESSGLKNNTPITSSADSLNLRYTNINPSQFPLIESLVTVTNYAGFVVGKLDESNFKVHEDGIRELPIEVVELINQDLGVNVVLTIDRSGSMTGQPLEDAKTAASTFVQLMQSRDESALVSFSTLPQTDCPFTNNIDSLINAITQLAAAGSTAVFDALIHSSDLLRSMFGNQAIIILTDGADNRSQYTYQDVLNTLIPLEIQVFTIGLGLRQGSPEENILIDLADRTGGSYYYSPTSSDLEEIYRLISQRLHHRYQISYTTHNQARDGSLRHVRIDVVIRNNVDSDTASYRAPDDGTTVIPPDEENIVQVIPNPFTPNNDGFNDMTEFKRKDGQPHDWDIIIMNIYGRKIKELTNGERFWDGRDEVGALMFPGSYLYIVWDRKQVIHRGIVQLIR